MNKNASDQLIDIFQGLTPIAIIIFLFAVIFVAIAIAYAIRLWLVQTATFQIRQDLADIRAYLIKDESEHPVAGPLVIAENTIAQAPIVRSKLVIKKPRKAFMWVALAIPILLIIFVVILINKSSLLFR